MADVSASPKVYTIEDLQQHKTREDCWVLISGKVYNVTKFLDETDEQHPGGDEVLIEEGGRDATEAFEDVGHSDEARAMLPKMLVGDFKGESKVKKSAGAGTTSASGQQQQGK
ncbi:hypothetical protein A1Q1_04175 [Trichosporon asahii var. asahii CBS 2479]|uniref:Cytochrome b5 heme-binding domain-containing protein n=1 Tax=Trichosporon asahii var. asahii (strain ATCC 90039 / CBS 2479 / JCM 2466 / KCTC 7840 / NBRC 103889/ NCYC 2677 / UAMH 7654) TaxID=1186058 RepID=J5SRA9_TRIAS|nr:hypothetical protein A1Q1_04175 [Trichosporon asahii var. asahii CBS 2479]EJT47101.1 hypothetical protein A1Q1_04175 [Trichosporon asahii var. asahii CBS 2479]